MSTSLLGNMRGPRLKTPSRLLLLLLLLSSQTGKVFCEEDSDPITEAAETENTQTVDAGEVQTEAGEAEAVQAEAVEAETVEAEAVEAEGTPASDVGSTTTRDVGDTSTSEDGSTSFIGELDEVDLHVGAVNSTNSPEEESGLDPVIILIPVAALILIAIIIGIIVKLKCNKNTSQELKKEDPFLEASSTEKVPMPMFEEDVPSVLELEMDELDQWMKKDS